jgi:NADH-quinone oxidoreductase subunit D
MVTRENLPETLPVTEEAAVPPQTEFREIDIQELRALQALGGPVPEEHMVLNLGPQHPSTHGVLRLLLELEGETIVNCIPDIGFLHTGIEKNIEAKTYIKGLTLTDRIDYLNPPMNNLAYSLAVEKLFGVTDRIPLRAQYLRVILCELYRIASHLVWLGTHALDLAAMSVFLYCFREREHILDIMEMVSGARMMTSYIRPGGVWRDVPEGFEEAVRAFLDYFPPKIDEYEAILTHNPLWLERTKGIGVISAEDAIRWSLTGPSLRGSGVNYDVRKAQPYSSYDHFEFNIPLGTNGDVYDRYLCRIQEMRESLKIIRQALDNLPKGPVVIDDRKIVPPPRSELSKSMEALIHHFKLWTEGFHPPAGEVYVAIESARGEYGCYIRSDGSNKPARCHFRTPSFANLQALPVLAKGHLVADLVAIIGSIDIVLGDVDR